MNTQRDTDTHKDTDTQRDTHDIELSHTISRKLHHRDLLGKDSFCGGSPNIPQNHGLEKEVVSSHHWDLCYVERGLKADMKAKDSKILV